MHEHPKPRFLVLHVPAGGGHKAAAHALAEQAAEMNVDVEVMDALAYAPRWFARGYVKTHLTGSNFAPGVYGYGYEKLNHRHPTLDRVRRSVDRAVGRRLVETVRNWQPDAVIATHFHPLSVIGAAKLRKQLRAPLVGVVTDYAAHAWWAEPGVDLFCTAAGGAALDLARHGAPSNCIVETGIPIRPAFARVMPRSMNHRSLKVLMTCGGHGIGPLERAIRSFAGLPHLELTVVCGANETRLAQARAAAERANVKANVIGFERDMPARIGDADVVIGKPGGLTVSESIACGRPMLLFGTCPGQEQHNEDWLRLNGAALAVEPQVCAATIDMLRRSGSLVTMAAAAKRLGRPRAARHILDATLAQLHLACAA
jgi:processive 1,2-diacylglycerol beta-glucosyltransferase